MRVAIVGGGMAGLVLARGLVHRGVQPTVVERMPSSVVVEGPIMLPFQAYDALEEIGLLEGIRAAGRDVPPIRNGEPVAINVARQLVLEALRDGLEVLWEQEVTDLLRDGGRVTGVRVRGPEGEREIAADIVVGADGTHSRVRELAGIEAEVRVSETAFVSFRSPVHSQEAILINFTSDGRQATLLDWPGGSVGGWQIERPEGGEQAALAPGVEAFKKAYLRLLPGAAEAIEPVTKLSYREVTEVSCETWWKPGVTLIGEALHAMNPEAGIGSGLGMADAQALAIAIGQNRADPDRALAEYERWRRPAIAPYLAIGSKGVRVVRGGELRDEERWPPPEGSSA
jgi:2-polyprenyl-6-methoxyphenol hydroxylase-like FAD-dependent oxidoreductase